VLTCWKQTPEGKLKDTAQAVSQQFSTEMQKAGVEIATGEPPPAALAIAPPSTCSCTEKEGNQYFADDERRIKRMEGVKRGGLSGICGCKGPQSYCHKMSPMPSVVFDSNDHLPVIFAMSGLTIRCNQVARGTSAPTAGGGGGNRVGAIFPCLSKPKPAIGGYLEMRAMVRIFSS